MSEPFIAQIQMWGCNFAPKAWAFCDGSLMPIRTNTPLFSLLSTVYGGDGKTSFGLPDLRGRVPMGTGDGPGLSNRTLGEAAGEEQVNLTNDTIPTHTHNLTGEGVQGASVTPGGNLMAKAAKPGRGGGAPINIYTGAGAGSSTLSPLAVGISGSGEGHDNMQPWLALNFCIALSGIFPNRN